MTQKIAYTYEEAADQIGVSVTKIKEKVKDGELVARKIDTLVRIEHQELIDWFHSLPAK